ncbi:hypothetical protein EJ06DRAFT_371422 [Trichodelitschia bisporula]|uniref:Uncharacterized protein n=1 Tax=Trichodelitschia bisporula TaxID=703511 RepID=A0A6G1I123_9PEZI|nr:hypothetical protein EJ06DRAFT_371422 [Trichodelitschia bisporula]
MTLTWLGLDFLGICFTSVSFVFLFSYTFSRVGVASPVYNFGLDWTVSAVEQELETQAIRVSYVCSRGLWKRMGWDGLGQDKAYPEFSG